MSFIAITAMILVLTQLVSQLCRRVQIPEVIGQILVGIVIGPAVLNIVKLGPLMNSAQEFGVIILMFIAGLESDIDLLKRYMKPAIIVAICGVILPVALMGGASLLFGFNHFEALFTGVIFSATSVSISVAVLREYHQLNSKEGATILGAAVADDIIGVILLSVMISMMSGMHLGHTTQHQPLGLIIVEQLAFFGGAYLLVRWLAPYLMHTSEKMLTMASTSVMAMIICLAMAALADAVGLSGAIGAFFAGIAVANTNVKEVVDRSFTPIGNALFIPLFFVSVGLNMRLNHFISSLVFLVVMTVLACLTKLIGCGIGARLCGFDWGSANVIGSGMVARGEMALITAQIGFNAHLMSNKYYSDIITVIILATVIAPFMLRGALKKSSAKGIK